MRTLPAALVFLLPLMSTGCFKPGSDANDEVGATETDACPVGIEGCACTPGGGCDPGLDCVDGMCSAAGTTDTTAGTTDTTTDTTGTTDTTAGTTDTTTGTTTNAGGEANGAPCTADAECMSDNCYVVPFLGGQCGECNEDADCPDGGCTMPNPFASEGSMCNMGELDGGCETQAVCMDGLSCGNVLDLLGLIQINTCGECNSDADCGGQQLCAPLVDVMEFSGHNGCIDPNTLPQDSLCQLAGNGAQACQSGICSTVDVMGLAEIGACGECNSDADCMGICSPGELIFDSGTLIGSTCQ